MLGRRLPVIIAERRAPGKSVAERLEFDLGLHTIHVTSPLRINVQDGWYHLHLVPFAFALAALQDRFPSRSFSHGDPWPVMFRLTEQFADHSWHVSFTKQNKADSKFNWASLGPAKKDFGSTTAIAAQFHRNGRDGVAD